MNLLRRAATTAVVCLALPALAACSGGEATPEVADPTTPTVVTPTQTPTEPPEPVEPELPEAATKKTKAGAVAFVQHYWDMVAYAQETGDTAGLKRLGGPFCTACDSGIASLEEDHQRGASIKGGVSTIIESSVDVLRTQEGHEAYKVAIELQNTRQVITQPGKKRQVFKASTTPLVFFLDHQDSHWRVASWERG